MKYLKILKSKQLFILGSSQKVHLSLESVCPPVRFLLIFFSFRYYIIRWFIYLCAPLGYRYFVAARSIFKFLLYFKIIYVCTISKGSKVPVAHKKKEDGKFLNFTLLRHIRETCFLKSISNGSPILKYMRMIGILYVRTTETNAYHTFNLYQVPLVVYDN